MCACSTATTASRSRRSRRRRNGEIPAPGDEVPESSDGLLAAVSRIDLASARPAGRSFGSHAGGGSRSLSTRTASDTPAGQERRAGGVQPTAASGSCSPGRSRPLPERVLQTSGGRMGVRAGRDLGGAAQRGRRSALHSLADIRRGRPGAAPRRRPVPGVPARARARDARGSRRRRSRCAAPRHGAARHARRAARRAAGPRRARARASAATRRPTRRRSSVARTSCSTRR